MLVDLQILSYHRFTNEPNDYRFSRTYDQFGQDISKKVYDLITIDDGMRCVIRACEMLRYCNIRAKLFICTSLIEQEGYCTWDEIKELSRYHDIENHSHEHVYLDKLDIEAVLENMIYANGMIQQHVGKIPRYFVAPYNSYSMAVDIAAERCGLISLKGRENILNISK